MLPRIAALLALAAAAFALVACGGDEKGSSGTSSGSSGDQAAQPAPVSKDLKERPKIGKPAGDPPPQLVKKDIVEGDGTVARKGDNVRMQYVGVNFSTGDEFDASWNRGEPFEFTLGGGQVIQGWDEGIAGMREGGRRELIIPPAKGYGAQGSPPSIPPNETLVFVVDLVKVTRPR
jgi:peptidylprolyl isomerase